MTNARPTWRKSLTGCSSDFCMWLDTKKVQLTLYKKLVADSDYFLSKILSGQYISVYVPFRELLDDPQNVAQHLQGILENIYKPQDIGQYLSEIQTSSSDPVAWEHYATTHFVAPVTCTFFGERLRDVSRNCAKEIYNKEMVAAAYAYVHLLDRYKRFWDVLLCLLDKGLLPMSARGIDVLDIGAGPAVASYAVIDMYKALHDFATEGNYTHLVTPPPRIHVIEPSDQMVHFFHNFSEIREQSKRSEPKAGPFGTIFPELVDFTEEREKKNPKKVGQLQKIVDPSSGSVSWYINYEETTHELYRYNFVIMSYFLTTMERTEELLKELESVFHTLRPGGIAVVVGDKDWKPIYELIEQQAEVAGVHRMNEVPDEISLSYTDVYAEDRRAFYTKIWRDYLTKYSNIDQEFAKSRELPRNLWNAPKKLKGNVSEFGLRVFRKGRWGRG